MSVLRIRRDSFLDDNFSPVEDWEQAKKIIREEAIREAHGLDRGYSQRLQSSIYLLKLCEREGMKWPGSIGAMMAEFRGSINLSPA
jgi:hypothetical protein